MKNTRSKHDIFRSEPSSRIHLGMPSSSSSRDALQSEWVLCGGTSCETIPPSPDRGKKSSFVDQISGVRDDVNELKSEFYQQQQSFYENQKGLIAKLVADRFKELEEQNNKYIDELEKKLEKKFEARLEALKAKESDIKTDLDDGECEEIAFEGKSENEELSSKLNVFQKKVVELESLNTTLSTEAQTREITRSEEIITISEKMNELSVRQATLYDQAIRNKNLFHFLLMEVINEMGFDQGRIKKIVNNAYNKSNEDFVTWFFEHEGILDISPQMIVQEIYPLIKKKITFYCNNEAWDDKDISNSLDCEKKTNIFLGLYNMRITTKEKALTFIEDKNLLENFNQYLDSRKQQSEDLSSDAQKPDSEKNYQMSVAESKDFPEPDPQQRLALEAVQQRALQDNENPELVPVPGEAQGQDLDVTVSGDIWTTCVRF